MGRDRELDKQPKKCDSSKAKDRDRDRDREEDRAVRERGRDRDRDRGREEKGASGRPTSGHKSAEEAKASTRSSAKGDAKAAKKSDPKRAKGTAGSPDGKGAANGRSVDGHEAITGSKTKRGDSKPAKDDADVEQPHKKRKVDKSVEKPSEKLARVKTVDAVSTKVESADKINKEKKAETTEKSEKAAETRDAKVTADPVQIVAGNGAGERQADKSKQPERAKTVDKSKKGPMAAAALDAKDGTVSVAGSDGSYSYSPGGSSYSGSADGAARGKKRRDGLRGANGFSTSAPAPPLPLGVSDGVGDATYGPSLVNESALVPMPDKLRGLIDNSHSLAMEVARMKQAVEAASFVPPTSSKLEEKSESKETVLKMPSRLTENLLHPDNMAQLLARTGLLSATLNGEGLVVLKAASRKGLAKALSQLRRVAYHCQWGSGKARVTALLANNPARPVQTMVVRLAATSSRLQSFEARLTHKVRKLRIGTQAGICQMVVEGIPGLSRKHCTITFEPEKGACYVQDLSTNGSYFNGKRLPRPPYKNPQDARVRVFHGDELFFRLRTDDAEELGYVINLLELS